MIAPWTAPSKSAPWTETAEQATWKTDHTETAGLVAHGAAT